MVELEPLSELDLTTDVHSDATPEDVGTDSDESSEPLPPARQLTPTVKAAARKSAQKRNSARLELGDIPHTHLEYVDKNPVCVERSSLFSHHLILSFLYTC